MHHFPNRLWYINHTSHDLPEFPDVQKRGIVQQAATIKTIESRMDLLQSVISQTVPGASETLDMLLYDEALSRESAEIELPPARNNIFIRADNNFIFRIFTTNSYNI